MRPGPNILRQLQTHDGDNVRPAIAPPVVDIARLGDEQGRVIAALQNRPNGMTVRQLEVSLSWPKGTGQSTVDGLLERELVAKLNTVIPSYVYRHGGVDQEIDPPASRGEREG